MRTAHGIAAALVLLFGSAQEVRSAIYPCEGENGRRVFQDTPCEGLAIESEDDQQQDTNPNQEVWRAAGSGSGFLVHPSGFILTSAHVALNAARLTVMLHDGRKYLARVLDSYPDKDLALLKIDASDLPSLPLADSSKVQHLDPVVIIGYPLADILGSEVSTSRGDISAIRSSPSGSLFQITAAVNPGNSGGPIIDEHGEVIGVVAAKLDSLAIAQTLDVVPEGISFAIPAQAASDLMEQVPRQKSAVTAPPAEKLGQREIFRQSRNAVVLVHRFSATTDQGLIDGNDLEPILDLSGIWEFSLNEDEEEAQEVRIEPYGSVRFRVSGDERLDGTYEQVNGRLIRVSSTLEEAMEQVWLVQTSEYLSMPQGTWSGASLTRIDDLPAAEAAAPSADAPAAKIDSEVTKANATAKPAAPTPAPSRTAAVVAPPPSAPPAGEAAREPSSTTNLIIILGGTLSIVAVLVGWTLRHPARAQNHHLEHHNHAPREHIRRPAYRR